MWHERCIRQHFVRLFSCQKCDQVLFFENTVCTSCGQSVGFCVEAAALVSLPKHLAGASNAPSNPDRSFKVVPPHSKSGRYTRCKNWVEHGACNWLVNAADRQEYCRSCRLTEPNPALASAENRNAWLEIERAKRRLLFSLFTLKLTALPKAADPKDGLSFRFQRGTDEKPVMTGHDEGLITLNIAEAEGAFRENMREMMGEAYRTVLGHLRHESGHYYWNLLVRGQPALSECRRLFGNDELSYQEALDRHYKNGAPADWRSSYISEYATMHPWEDWAETWAHYLHMVDTLQTAKSHGLTVRVPGRKAGRTVATDALAFRDYESLSTSWSAVTLALNDMNRSMGMKDVYPFVLSPAVHEKLRFVHGLILAAAPALAARQQREARLAAERRSLASWFGWLRPHQQNGRAQGARPPL
jgi:hypothetical protein